MSYLFYDELLCFNVAYIGDINIAIIKINRVKIKKLTLLLF